MSDLPTKDAVKGSIVTVGDFVKAACGRIPLEVVVGGSSLDTVIEETILNRPGLALTGYFENFAWKRVQIIGNAEAAYLASLSPNEQSMRFKALLAHNARVFVFTAGHTPSKTIISLAKKAKAVLLRTTVETFEFSRHSIFVMESLAAPRTALYGTMIEVCGLGVLFEGAPGMGKSETALGLIKRGCALIADDLTCIRKDVASNLLFASASDTTAGFMEIRGIGIIDVMKVFDVNAIRGEKRLQLVITFKRLQDIAGEVDRTGQTRKVRNILGVNVPNIIIPVSEGRDLVNLVETAAQQHKLIQTGYNPVSVLSSRLHKRAGNQKSSKQKG